MGSRSHVLAQRLDTSSFASALVGNCYFERSGLEEGLWHLIFFFVRSSGCQYQPPVQEPSNTFGAAQLTLSQ